jgi:hypothetical protein
MRRALSIAAMLLLLAQAVAASVPMIHPAQPAPMKAHAHGKHDCCPPPKFTAPECCPRAVACAMRHHGAGACCCAGPEETAAPTRQSTAPVPAAYPAAASIPSPPSLYGDAAIAGRIPLDNSPPVLVLRN